MSLWKERRIATCHFVYLRCSSTRSVLLQSEMVIVGQMFEQHFAPSARKPYCQMDVLKFDPSTELLYEKQMVLYNVVCKKSVYLILQVKYTVWIVCLGQKSWKGGSEWALFKGTYLYVQ